MNALATVRSATDADWSAVTKLAELSYSPEAQDVLKRLRQGAAEFSQKLEVLKAKEAALDAREAALAERERTADERAREALRQELRELWSEDEGEAA